MHIRKDGMTARILGAVYTIQLDLEAYASTVFSGVQRVTAPYFFPRVDL